MKRIVLCMTAISILISSSALFAQGIQQTKGSYQDKFRQLDEVLADSKRLQERIWSTGSSVLAARS